MKKRLFGFVLFIIILAMNVLYVAPTEDVVASDNFEIAPKVAVGEEHIVALKSDGTVWCWGKNDCGQLGNGTCEDSEYEPVQVLGLEDVVDIDSCRYRNSSIALKSDGTVWCWGNVGVETGSSDERNIPVQVEGIENVIDVSSGDYNVVAVKSDGSVWTWGDNFAGQLGNNDRQVSWRYDPGKVEGISDVVSVDITGSRVVALKSDGTVWIWGGNSECKLVGGGGYSSYSPIRVNGVNDVQAIEAGEEDGDVYMLDKQGTVWKLETPRFETDEDGKSVLVTQPEYIRELSNIDTISPSMGGIYAIDTIGNVWICRDGEPPEKNENIQECIYFDDILFVENIAIKKDGSIWILKDKKTPYRIFDDFSLLKVELLGISLDGPKEVQGSDMCVVELGSSIELNLICEPLDASIDKAKVQWTSSNADIATVGNGIVTGIKQGRVTISASIEGKKASYIVTVIPTVGYNICTSCNGVGEQECWMCYGEMYTKCTSCRGDTTSVYTKSCGKCYGSGKISTNENCQICHGVGISFSESFQTYVTCAFCNGTGKFLYTRDCSTCKGTGKETTEVKCSMCNGKGQYTCSHCDDGYNECYTCSGEGKIRCELYTISYDANGGTNLSQAQVKIENSNLQISDIIPERKGYNFCGWAYAKSATVPDYMPGDYITDNDSVKLYAVWEEEKILKSISIAQMPHKLNYVEGEVFKKDGLVVKANYSNNTSSYITTYQLTGYESTPGEKKIKITYDGKIAYFTITVKPKVPQAVTSGTYKVSGNVISKVTIGTTIKKLVSSINESKYVKVFKNQTEVKSDETISTGMMVNIMEGSTVAKSYKIIVTGDVNGDGNATVTDMLAIKAHILGKNKLSDEYATAADTSGDNAISITDFIQLKAKVLGKGSITAR